MLSFSTKLGLIKAQRAFIRNLFSRFKKFISILLRKYICKFVKKAVAGCGQIRIADMATA